MKSIGITAKTERRPVRRFVVCLGACCVLLLAACASLPPLAPATATNTMPAAHFTLTGRLSVRVNDKLDVGNIKWLRAPSEERVGIYTPFGSQVAELVKTGEGVVLRRGDEILHAKAVDELTASLLGVSLDIDGVANWVQGVGLIAEKSRDISLRDGSTWQVTVSNLQAAGGHVYASRLTAINGDTVVKLVIDEWRPL